ncbi:hypothetical protein [Pedobacter gandavensis]|uniref:DUF5655 domain-containing protein n=1 Tax=Pedobacter gandavensis TaxID=2679963 RepID=A0ABR6EUA8_9SPHI|nr:hypothetical protein [Pedobacter gandavensis]MBB2148632.1 hypothetical protein [Pedobacter gandavensis]
MGLIDQNGKFIGKPAAMTSHQGYETFDELKFALVKALDSKDDEELKRFADQIAPSKHILFFLKDNPFNRKSIGILNIGLIKQKYYHVLLEFKLDKWQRPNAYNHRSLPAVPDYTAHEEGDYVGNMRYWIRMILSMASSPILHN